MNKVRKWVTKSNHFMSELIRRYREDEVSLAASSLAYTAMLSMVPFMSVLLTVFSAMPLFEDASQLLQNFIFDNFVPATGAVIQTHLMGFVEKARGLTVTMFMAVFVTSILMMHTMEKALNRIFNTKPSGRFVQKVLIYWAVLTMGPLLVGGGVALSTMMFNSAALASMKGGLIKVLPVLSSCVGFFLVYLVVPNRKVNWKNAMIGALFAAVCFELAKKGFAMYVTSIPSYQQVYGALAVIPLFLIWLFLSWNIILFGGLIAATLESSRWRMHVQDYRDNQRLLLVMEMLNQLRLASRVGQELSPTDLSAKLYFVPDDVLSDQLNWLQEEKIITVSQNGNLVLRQDLSVLKFQSLYERGSFKMPLQAAPYFKQYQPMLDNHWAPVNESLVQPLSKILTQINNTKT